MTRIIIIFIAIVLVLLGGIFLLNNGSNELSASAEIPLSLIMGGSDTVGYARAVHPIEFEFPRDHGPHPTFKTEWWYLTGNLQTNEGRPFGYQFTIFRHGLSPINAEGNSEWRTNQLYMGHFALSDIEAGRFYFFERFSRGAQDLAGAQAKPFRVWLEDWQIDNIDGEMPGDLNTFRMHAGENPINLQLNYQRIKPFVLQGDNGLSQKGEGSGNASYYYSATRLESEGLIQVGDKSYLVSGQSWLDREWSTSALAEDQVGWDWFSLQLDNNREIMYYQLRRSDGSADQFSKGIIVEADGTGHLLKQNDVNLQVIATWDSPRGGTYPAGWKLDITSHETTLLIKPLIPDQELDLAIRYWEGAVSISGSIAAEEIEGKGFVELTGYAK